MKQMVGKTNESARRAWLERTLAAIPRGARLLDAGAGEMQHRPLCAHLDYVSQDLARYEGEGDGTGIHTGTWEAKDVDIISDITSIPEPDASFDAVLCTEVLEHLPHPIDALRELSRLLKPGGVLILTAPFCSLSHFSPYFFHTGFSANFYRRWLDDLGLDIEELVHNGNYFEYLAQELRRLPDVARDYAGTEIGWLWRRAIRTLLTFLGRLSKRDRGSKDLLAYGLHVRARKRAASNRTSP
ncbi:MAG: class I SAM-dependent methyltransferase [Planctomycetota bacterium]|jgi:SAM-dependent methyltransferase